MNPDIELETSAEARARRLPAPLKALDKLASNYWWSWAPDGPELFRDLEPGLWQQCDLNPRALLAQVSDLRLAQMAADPAFAERVQQLSDRFDSYMTDARPWPGLRTSTKVTRETPVAYFCAEYGIHSSLPLYSGGLGILAGDHLKSASDLNLPLVAIGLFYNFGYFRQSVTPDDWQAESYKRVYGDELPLELVKRNDAPVSIDVAMRGRTVRACAWRANVGRVQLYLLDTNLPDNDEVDRLISGYLYGGDRETRLVQEMMLGLGGVRLLRALGLQPSVFHLNEGHSAFLSLELSRELIEQERINFGEAAARVREQCVFTTHTPVAAGHDEFSPELIKQGFGNWYETALGLSLEEFLSLGRVKVDTQEPFGLTPLALRMSWSTNGVSRKHGEVSRELWHKMWPERSVAEVPIASVTNGVHAPTWVASPIRSLYEKLFGEEWIEMARHASAWSVAADKISDAELWQAHLLLKQRLVAFVRDRCFDARLARGDSNDHIESARTMFDPAILTIGFARRIAGYKRWDLLLSDEARLTRLLNDSEKPIQFVLAGKAHPHDQGAKLILQKLLKWQRDKSVRHRVAFIEDYDQEVARQLVQGVDVWMNVPRRPYEASGTSGQKAAMNGVLNFSVLDGWWLEGFDGENGFAIGDTGELSEADADQRDAESLYSVLEEQLIPRFYDRDEADLPRRWLAMMKRSIQTLVPAFNSDRMVAEYAERIYSA